MTLLITGALDFGGCSGSRKYGCTGNPRTCKHPHLNEAEKRLRWDHVNNWARRAADCGQDVVIPKLPGFSSMLAWALRDSDRVTRCTVKGLPHHIGTLVIVDDQFPMIVDKAVQTVIAHEVADAPATNGYVPVRTYTELAAEIAPTLAGNSPKESLMHRIAQTVYTDRLDAFILLHQPAQARLRVVSENPSKYALSMNHALALWIEEPEAEDRVPFLTDYSDEAVTFAEALDEGSPITKSEIEAKPLRDYPAPRRHWDKPITSQPLLPFAFYCEHHRVGWLDPAPAECTRCAVELDVALNPHA